MARTQQQSPYAAVDACLIFCGSNSGLATYGRILAMMAGGMLSLSNVRRASRKLLSDTIFLDVSQKSSTILPLCVSLTLAGLSPLRMHTASITIFTGAGGDFMPLTSVMSFFESVSSARSAASSMGIASPSCVSQSSLIACTLAASALAEASSLDTTALTLSASIVSRAITSMAASVSLPDAMSCGCSASSSSCIPLTCSSVKASFSRPTSYRFWNLDTSVCRTSSRFLKREISSRYEVGVT
mmetsp:Transcript_66610/g.210909  ORF Transcript_66610/g.210909 Transcript_66610/m.210909 type:complete len:242 (+) Transcript_66610:24-749(+)